MRFWLACIVICVAATSARADEAADREEAGKEFSAGQAADRQRNWQLAIDHYLRANDLVPHPNAMFNIATDYEHIGKLRDAASWYQRYIDTAPDSADRDKVVRLLRDLSARPGTLTVRTIPDGARVLVDNEFKGVTPYSGHIKGGSHKVIIEHEGQREQRDVRIEYGEPAVVDVTLRGVSGTLVVSGTPAGALVTVDQMPAGSMPVRLPLPPGPHAIRVTAYGYAPYDTTAEVAGNQDTPVDVQLTRALGTFDNGGDGKPKPTFGYLFGVGGGADVRGEGSLFMIEFGGRITQYDFSVRIGKTVGDTAIDLLVRWTLTKSKVAPFIAAGYTFISSEDTATSSSGSGYALLGGLRWDVSRAERGGVTLLLESGIRYYTGLSGSGAQASESGLIVPLMASVQFMYR